MGRRFNDSHRIRGWRRAFLLAPLLICLCVIGAIPATSGASGFVWQAQNPGSAASELRAVAFSDVSHGWAVGDNYDGATDSSAIAIVATDDGGQHWTPQITNTPGMLLSVSFPDSTHGWAVGYSADDAHGTKTAVVVATADGGQHWTSQSAISAAVLTSVVFTDASHGWAVGYSEDSRMNQCGVILATSDGGETWAPQYSGSVDTVMLSVTFIDAFRGWAAGWDSSGPIILATSDGGANWAVQWRLDALVRSVFFLDNTHGWAVGDTLLATTDGGQHWNVQSPRTNLGMGLDHVFFSDAKHGWALGGSDQKGGMCLVTSDGGATWVTGPAALTGLAGMDFPDSSHGFAVGQRGTAAGISSVILAGVLDSVGPVTSAKANSGRKGHAIALHYKITDDLSPKATAIRIVVKNGHGTTVKTFRPTNKVTAAWFSVKWTPKATGTYRYYVYGKDLAGNVQSKVGSAKVVVR